VKRGGRSRFLLPLFLGAMLALAWSCADILPGKIGVTINSDPALDGTKGDLRIEVHERTAAWDLRGINVQDAYTLDWLNPFEVTMDYVAPGDYVVVAWLDVNGNRVEDSGDVIPLCACGDVTVPPDGVGTVAVDLDTVAP
jgi:uncharacterized protein (DUF2141 family)